MPVHVKICGITHPSDALLAVDAGADAIGLVFYAPSPRAISDLREAREIARAASPFVTVTGLFVDAAVEEVKSILSQVPLNLLQFHGDESNQYCAQFERPFIKAIRMKPGIDLDRELAKYPDARGFLLDAYVKHVPGGTGKSFNWEEFPKTSPHHLILAGGLNPDNVSDAIEATQAKSVDASGGVELSARKKDGKLMRAFVSSAKMTKLEKPC